MYVIKKKGKEMQKNKLFDNVQKKSLMSLIALT